MTDDCRNEIETWVRGRYPGMQPYERKLVRRVLELRFCDGAPLSEQQLEREASGFRAYYLRRYRGVRDAVNDAVADGSAARAVKNGLLLYRWLTDPAATDGGPDDFDAVLGTDIRQLEIRVGEALKAADVSHPFEGFAEYLAAYLWARVFHNGHQRSGEELREIASRETRRLPSWEREVGTAIDSSVQSRFPTGAPDGLADNLRKTLWKYDPSDDWRGLLSDSLEVAEALHTKAPWERVTSIIDKRIAGQIKNLVREHSHIDVRDVLQEAWRRVQEHYSLEPARAPELPGLVSVIARRVVLDELRPKRIKGPGNHNPPSPNLRSLPYSMCAPHQSLAWTWIEVFGKTPRWAANYCCRKTLFQNSQEVKTWYRQRGHSRLDFLQALDDKLACRLKVVGLNKATYRIYQHLLDLECGRTHPWHYLTGDLSDDIAARLPKLEALCEDLKIQGLQRQMPHWAQSVNRVWRPEAIEQIFFAKP